MKIVFVLVALALILSGEALTVSYNHTVVLESEQFVWTEISLNEGDAIKMCVVGLNGDNFRVTIHSPFQDILFDRKPDRKIMETDATYTMLNATYTIPAPGRYTIWMDSPGSSSDVNIGYTITRIYKWHFGITRHQDIILEQLGTLPKAEIV